MQYIYSMSFQPCKRYLIVCSVRNELQNEVDNLRDELQNNQKTFELYRDRARLSLKQTASEQKAADQTIHELTDKLKVGQSYLHLLLACP